MGKQKQEGQSADALQQVKDKITALRNIADALDKEETAQPEPLASPHIVLHDAVTDATDHISLEGENEKQAAFLQGVNDLRTRIGFGSKGDPALGNGSSSSGGADGSGSVRLDVTDAISEKGNDDVLENLQKKYHIVDPEQPLVEQAKGAQFESVKDELAQMRKTHAEVMTTSLRAEKENHKQDADAVTTSKRRVSSKVRSRQKQLERELRQEEENLAEMLDELVDMQASIRKEQGKVLKEKRRIKEEFNALEQDKDELHLQRSETLEDRKKVQDVQSRLRRKEMQLAALESSLQEKEEQLDQEHIRQNEMLKHLIAKTKARSLYLDDLEKTLNERGSVVAEGEKALAYARDELDHVRQQLQIEERRLKHERKEQAAQQVRFDKEREKVRTFKAHMEEYVKELSEKERDLLRREAQVGEFEQFVDVKLEEFEKRNDSLRILEEKLTESEKELQSRQRMLSHREKRFSKQQGEFDSARRELEKKAAQLETRLRALDDDRQMLLQKKNELQSYYQQKEKDLQELEEQIRADRQNLDQERAEYRKDLECEYARKEDMRKKKINQIEQEYAKKKKQLESSFQKKEKDLQRKNADFEKYLAGKEKDLVAAMQQHSQLLKREVLRFKERFDQLEQELVETYRARQADLDDALADLQRQRADYRARMQKEVSNRTRKIIAEHDKTIKTYKQKERQLAKQQAALERFREQYKDDLEAEYEQKAQKLEADLEKDRVRMEKELESRTADAAKQHEHAIKTYKQKERQLAKQQAALERFR
ncbi:MAG: hypothetical protein ACOCWQ_02210, partial [Nanoarchaeota archaeon]